MAYASMKSEVTAANVLPATDRALIKNVVWVKIPLLKFIESVFHIDISYTLDSASVYQKVKPKISAVSPHNNRRRPYWFHIVPTH